MPRFLIHLAAAIVAGACATAQVDLGAIQDDATWYGVYIDGGPRVGASSVAETPWEGGRRTVETFEVLANESNNAVIRIADRITRFTDDDGQTTRIERMSSDGRDLVQLTVDIRDGVATAIRKTKHDETIARTEIAPRVRFDGGDGLLASWNFAADGDLVFDSFNLGAIVVERVVMRFLSADPTSGERRLERAAYRDGKLVSVSELTVDLQGRVVHTGLDMFGFHMMLRPISAAEAATPPTPLNPVTNVLVKSPHRISNQAMRGHIRYVFGFKGGRDFHLPETSDQKVSMTGGDATVEICVSCGPGLSKAPQFLEAGLRSTMWLQSDADKLREIAVSARREAANEQQTMEALAVRVRRIMGNLDFTGHYSALEALERRAGDCAEDALLLTALARAAGIPAYVVTGLVYSRERYHGVSNVFVPHNWTIAFVDGEWKSFDATLGEFDATHIAISINEGEANAMATAQQLAGQLEWRGMAEVRAAPQAEP